MLHSTIVNFNVLFELEFRIPLNFISRITDSAEDSGVLACVSDVLIARIAAATMNSNGLYVLKAELTRPTTAADAKLIRQALNEIDQRPWKITRCQSDFVSYMSHEITTDYDKIPAEHVVALQNKVP